jgi:hypothetical protein
VAPFFAIAMLAHFKIGGLLAASWALQLAGAIVLMIVVLAFAAWRLRRAGKPF